MWTGSNPRFHISVSITDHIIGTSVPFFHTLASGENSALQWGHSQPTLYPTDIINITKLDPTPPTGDSKRATLWAM